LINNRQNGRRRGRGGQGGPRGPNIGGQPGNRQDNRQRGNAAQLLEKYKSMARDAQLAGDRVQTEYYLQYADHYFRVLSESRSRFEDQRRSRDDDVDDEDGDEEMLEAGDGEDERNDRPDRSERQAGGERQDRGNRPERGERNDRPARRDRPRFARDDRGSQDDDGSEGAARANGNGGIADILPPAIGGDNVSTLPSEDEGAPRPRRRTRAPRPPEDDEVAPAA